MGGPWVGDVAAAGRGRRGRCRVGSAHGTDRIRPARFHLLVWSPGGATDADAAHVVFCVACARFPPMYGVVSEFDPPTPVKPGARAHTHVYII